MSFAARLRTWSRRCWRRGEGRPEVVFLGDSITEFWPGHDRRLFRAGRINRGVSGETSHGMRARFAADVLALHPRIVHIMAGTNDLWHGQPGPHARATLDNLSAMAAAAHAHDIAVILAEPPPMTQAAIGLLAHGDLLEPLRRGIAGLCREEGLLHLDYARSLAGPDGHLRPAFTTDGIHLTRRGYLAMRGQAERALRVAGRNQP